MLESLMPFLTDPTTLLGASFLCASGVANLLVHLLPVPSDTSHGVYKVLMKLVNLLAANFGKARNVTASPTVSLSSSRGATGRG